MKSRFVIICFVAVVAGGCSKKAQQPVQASQGVPAIDVQLATAEVRPVEKAISVTGSLLPDESVNLGFEVPGTLAKVHVDFGQSVRKGQLLAELDRRELSLQLERSQAALAQSLARIGLSPGQGGTIPETTPNIRQAQAQYEDAASKFESARKLVESGDIARERFTEIEKQFRAREAVLNAAQDELRTLLAAVQGLRAEVALSEKRLEDASLRAPFDGAVTERMASPGQYLRENAPVLTIVKSHPLRLMVEVPESAVSRVRLGTALMFSTEAAPGAQYKAIVRQLNPTLDAKSRSLTAEGRLAGADPRLKPGMFVQVRLVTDSAARIPMVPRRAVYNIAGLSKVFVIRDGKAIEHKIQPGEVLGDWVEVPDAIQPGDKVAVSNLPALTGGSRVNVRN
jgi:membrane fusion protein, multidrug efflux system